MTKIVVTQPMEFSTEHKRRLRSLGDVMFYDDLAVDDNDWLRRCHGADIVCTGKYGFREGWPDLRNAFVSVPFVGTGFLDAAVLREHNVIVSRSPGCNRHAVSEWIVGMMIMAFRHLDELLNIDDLPSDQSPLPGRGLAFKNVTILGKGSIGSRVGIICGALEMNVRYFQRGDNLGDSVRDADVVVDTLSLNPSTIGLLGKDFFSCLKHGSIFITVTSDEIVDIDAMLQALDDGVLACAANDAGGILMGDTSDPFYQKLLAHPKVLVTPHISYNTDVTHEISNDMMIDNIEAYLAGKPINIVGV